MTNLTCDDILDAYRAGVFPMADNADDPAIYWVDPPMRGVIPLDGFHVSASLQKLLKKKPFRVSINQAFDQVIEGCAARTPVRGETWINAPIMDLYKQLHVKGFAHSVECWDQNNILAGGLYGLSIHGAFFGESMFSRVENASKCALFYLVARLNARGFTLLDCQFVNDHLLQFGCVEITRDAYHSSLIAALSTSDVSFVSGASSSDVSALSSLEIDSNFLFGSKQSNTVTS